jgi:hypothetical protein
MVEVDVFWSYGIGASFAFAAFRQLRSLRSESADGGVPLDSRDMLDVRDIIREMERGDSPAFDNEYFRKALLFLSILFVPSGANLLWSNPNWETMQVGSYETIPGWLVSAFSITNVTQGILGFWVTYNLLMRGKYYRAAMQTVGAYLGFWFILVNGWDKKGYQRFFSKDRAAFEDWSPSNVRGWLGSDVVRILLAYGAVFLPLMFYWLSKWLVDGYRLEADAETGQVEKPGGRLAETVGVAGYLLSAVFGVALGSAVCAHLLIRNLGWVKGLIAFSSVFYVINVAGWGLGPRLCKKIMRVDELEVPPVWEL